MLNRALTAALLLFTAPGLVFARGPGSTSANFLKIGLGARQVAMGETAVGLADDVNSMFYNPAGLGMLVKQEVSLMHNSYLEGITQEVGAYALPTRHFGTIGVGFNLLKVEEFDSFDALDQQIGTVDAGDLAASVTYAKEIGELRRLSVGGTARHIRSRLDEVSASASMFDVGVLARYGLEGKYETQYRLGGSIRNIGQEQKFINDAFALPQSLHIGGSRGSPMPHPFEDMRINIALDAVVPNDNIPFVTAGVEVRIVREFAIRLGYRANQDEGLGLSVGFGFTSLHRGFLPSWVPELSMDYALVDYGLLEQTHRIGFSMKFGRDKYQRDQFDLLFDPEEE